MAKIYPSIGPDPFTVTNQFEVKSTTVTRVKFENVPLDHTWILEERFNNGAACSDSNFWSVVDSPCCGPLTTCPDQQTITLPVPGVYRFVITRADNLPVNQIDTQGVEVFTRDIDDPSGAVATAVLAAQLALCNKPEPFDMCAYMDTLPVIPNQCVVEPYVFDMCNYLDTLPVIPNQCVVEPYVFDMCNYLDTLPVIPNQCVVEPQSPVTLCSLMDGLPVIPNQCVVEPQSPVTLCSLMDGLPVISNPTC